MGGMKEVWKPKPPSGRVVGRCETLRGRGGTRQENRYRFGIVIFIAFDNSAQDVILYLHRKNGY